MCAHVCDPECGTCLSAILICGPTTHLRFLIPYHPPHLGIISSVCAHVPLSCGLQELFAEYFDKAPVLEIPGRTFPVKTLYLEDAIEHWCVGLLLWLWQ